MTGNSNYHTAPAHVLGNVSGFHLPFAALLTTSHYAPRRSCDRPTGHLYTGFLASSVLQTNALTVPKNPSCYCMISMQPSQFKCIKISLFKVNNLLLQITRFSINVLVLFSCCFYQKDEQAKPSNLPTRWCSFFLSLLSCFSPFSWSSDLFDASPCRQAVEWHSIYCWH